MSHNERFFRLLDRFQEGSLPRRDFLKGAAALGLGAQAAAIAASPRRASAQATPSTLTPAGELTAVFPRSLVALDPHGAQSVEETTAVVSTHLHGTLISRDPASGELIPRLALSWEPTDDLTWTFKLREGVTFHDGSAFTSADVKASLERVIAQEGPLAPLWEPVTGVETPDPLTAVIRTSTPLGTVPVSATLLYIAPAAILESETFASQPFGLGSYSLVSWEPDSEIRMEANPNFWAGAPGLQSLVFRDIPETAGRVTALETGEIDFTYGLPADQLPALQENDELRIDTVSSYAYYFVWFNATREPFTNPLVRQAMAHALDIDTMVNDLLQGVAVRAQAPIPSTIFGFAPQTPYAYDPELARSLLEQAGYPDGFTTTFQWNPGSGPQDRELALTMISNWADIGVTVENLEKERAVWLEDLLALNWDMNFQTNTVRTGDADFTLRRLYVSSANRTGYANPELDTLLNDAAAASDPATREGLYAEACRIIWDDAVGIFPFELQENYISRTRVQGFVPAPNSIPSFETVTVTEE